MKIGQSIIPKIRTITITKMRISADWFAVVEGNQTSFSRKEIIKLHFSSPHSTKIAWTAIRKAESASIEPGRNMRRERIQEIGGFQKGITKRWAGIASENESLIRKRDKERIALPAAMAAPQNRKEAAEHKRSFGWRERGVYYWGDVEKGSKKEVGLGFRFIWKRAEPEAVGEERLSRAFDCFAPSFDCSSRSKKKKNKRKTFRFLRRMGLLNLLSYQNFFQKKSCYHMHSVVLAHEGKHFLF